MPIREDVMSALLFSILMVFAESRSIDEPREWTDASGHYTLSADLIARDANSVVLQKSDKSLVIVDISDLSDADKKYLESRETDKETNNSAAQTFTLKNSMEVKGNVVEYGRRDVTVRRRRGKIYVNDRLFENLPDVYQRMVPQIVAHLEKKEIKDEKAFKNWVLRLKGQPKTFVCDGVMLELENGDVYGVPIFFFSDKDAAMLKPGLDEWLAMHEAEKDEQKRAKYQAEMSLRLQAQMLSNEREKAFDRKIARLQLQLQAFDSGLVDLWEVSMVPQRGARGYPVNVVVPARDSRQASALAQARYRNYRISAVVKVIRKR